MKPAEIFELGDVGDTAEEMLGLSNDERSRLFRPWNWPDKFRQGCCGDGSKKTAKIAASRIEHFIKTKGKE
jgi:hypothetical protein